MIENAATEAADEASPTDEDRLEDVAEEARTRFARAVDVDQENRDNARSDTEFVWVKGKQWLADDYALREQQKRPALEINQLPQFIQQVVNDQRQSRPGIRVNPASREASKEVGEILQGLCRHIEYDSQAEAAYDSAFEHAVTGGRGYWRVISEYERSDSFNQRLLIKRVADPLSVYMDPDFQEPDASDAEWCFITETMTREDFTARYPDADPLSWDQRDASLNDWFIADKSVIVADYYRRVCKKRTLVAMSDGAVGWKDELPPTLPEGITIAQEREADDWRVEWFKIAGGEQVLEEFQWPGSIIPVVMCIGSEIVVGGKRIFQGLIRRARDPQMMYNYSITQIAELLALAPKAPWVMAEGQDEGYEDMWRDANRVPFSTLKYKPTTIDGLQSPPPQRTQPAQVPTGLMQQAEIARQDLRSTTGLYNASLGQQSNETSGRAILAREKQGDTATFHFHDNLSRAIALTGRIVVEVIPKFYDTERIVRIIQPDDTQKLVTINQAVPNLMGEAVEAIKANDVTAGKYAVTVESGPSYATKRQETAERLMDLVRVFPPVAGVASDLIVKSIDVADADLIAERLKLTLPPPVQAMLKAKEEDKPPPDPEMLQQLQTMQQQLQQAGQMVQGLQQELQQAKAGAAETVQKAHIDAEAKVQVAVVNAEADKQIAVIQERAKMGAGMGVSPEAVGLDDPSGMAAPQPTPIEQLMASMAQTLQVLAAPKQVIRDESGRAVGVAPMIQ